MESVSLRYSFCGKLDVCMDGWIELVLDTKRKDGWMDGWISGSLRCFLWKVRCMDGWMESVRYSLYFSFIELPGLMNCIDVKRWQNLMPDGRLMPDPEVQ